MSKATQGWCRSSLVSVRLLIEYQKDRDVLQAERKRLLHLKHTDARSALRDALFSGAWELEKQARHFCRIAREEGVLLFCWEGTRVLEGGAA